MFDLLKQWDRELFIYLNSLGVERYDAFWIIVTQEQTWIPLYALMIFLLVYTYRKNKKAALLLVCGFLASFLLTIGFTNLVKEIVARARPSNNESLAHIIRILQKPTYYSFFSGHTSVSMALTTFVTLVLRKKYKWAYLFYIWPLLFAASRIYVGVHYPSDLFVGALVGVIFAILIFKFILHYWPNEGLVKEPAEPLE